MSVKKKMSYVAIIVVLAVLLVLCVAALIIGIVLKMKNDDKQRKISAQPRTVIQRKSKPKKRSLKVPLSAITCQNNNDCNQGEICDQARIYYVDGFDQDTTPSNLQGTHLKPYQIPALEDKQLGVNDVMDYKRTLFIATTAPYVYVQPIDEVGRLVKTNIIAEDIAIYDGQLVGLSDGKMYTTSLSHMMSDEWIFAPYMGYDQVVGIESSADGRGLIVNTMQSTYVFVDGKQRAENQNSRRVFGSSPGEYAEFENGRAIIRDSEFNDASIVADADAGVFTSQGDFYHLSSEKAKGKVTRVRQAADQPIFISERTCKPKQSRSVRDLTL